jgi:Arc/MetJ-type ribon-helix-helix transcriptional regulator
MNLSISNEQFLDALVSAGAFVSRSEAINEAVDLLRRREELRAEIKIGLDQLDRGEGEPLDMDEIRREIRRRIGKE